MPSLNSSLNHSALAWSSLGEAVDLGGVDEAGDEIGTSEPEGVLGGEE